MFPSQVTNVLVIIVPLCVALLCFPLGKLKFYYLIGTNSVKKIGIILTHIISPGMQDSLWAVTVGAVLPARMMLRFR